MTAKATILRGTSGSGKTTLAKTLDGTRISRDDIRRLLFGVEGKTVLDSAGEKRVTKFQRDLIESELDAGRNVIVDDTNLNKSLLTSLSRFINDLGYDFTIRDVRVDVSTAHARNAARPENEQVPTHVIDRQQAKAWWGHTPSVPYVYKPYTLDMSLPLAYSFDLDGTLAHMNGKRGPYDFTKYHLDDYDEALACVGWSLGIDEGWKDGRCELIILTGRSEEYRAECEEWLIRQGVAWDRLIMRPEGDTRNDAVVKSDLWDEHISGKFAVLMHFDDRNRVVKGLRKKGIKVAQVAHGDF